MIIADGDVFDCEYLWAIQLSDLEGVRFIKVDQEGEEVAWTENLQDILPFVMADEADIGGDSDNDDDYDDDQADDLFDTDHIDKPRPMNLDDGTHTAQADCFDKLNWQ